MVRVAYSSGTPTIGVGTGNATTFIDTTANLDEAADKIMRSKTFDNASSCSSENSVVAHKDIYDSMIAAFEKAGAYIIRDNTEEKAKLQKTIWPDWPEKIGVLNREVPAANIGRIAQLAGINIPEDRKFIVVEENNGIGRQYPFTGEKLSVVTTLIKANDIDDALNKMEAIVEYQGKGHSCGIHTTNDELINKMALRMKVSRILVCQPQSLGNSGNWFNGLSNTMSLGCSTWGHNSTSNNLTWKDIVNYTVVSKPVEPNPPKDEDLFPADIRNATL
jgi:sulfoacetaldehyde dehydrogenase